MQKIKIFLASSEELKDEILELSDLVEHLNLILEPQDIHIYLEKWEYLAESSTKVPEEAYSDTLEKCEICMVVFGKDFGGYTERELKRAYERVCKEGVNPSKLYVYFKNIDDLTEDLKKFRDSFPEVYGHFTGKFSDVNTLKNDFLLQFQLFQSQNLQNSCPVEVKNSKVTVFGKDLFIDLMKIPFLGNNEDYLQLIKSIKRLKRSLSKMDPCDEDYAEDAAELQELLSRKSSIEAGLWKTALDITRLSNEKSSKRLQRAIELFNKGDNRGANAILDEDEIYSEAEHNKALFRLGEEGRKGLVCNIEEMKLKIQTLCNTMDKGWLEKVIEIQQKVSDYTSDVYGELSSEYIETLIEQIFYLDFSGDYEAQHSIACNIYNLCLDLFGEMHVKTADSMNLIGKALLSQQKYEEALTYEIRSLKIYKDILGENNIDVAVLYNNLGLIFGNIGDYQQALKYGLRAIDIYDHIKVEEDLSKPIAINNVGLAYQQLNDFDEALKHMKKALLMFDDIFKEENPWSANTYNTIGQVYRDMGELDQALQYQQQGLEMSRKFYGDFHPKTQYIYKSISGTCFAMKDYEKSLNYSFKLLEVQNKLLGKDNEENYDVLDNISYIYELLGDDEKASEYQVKAEKLKPEESMEKVNNEMALLYEQMHSLSNEGYFEEALERGNALLRKQIHNFGEKRRETAVVYNDIASIYIMIQEFELGLDNQKKALEIQEELLGEYHTDTLNSYDNLSHIYLVLGKYEEALHYQMLILKLTKELKGNNNPELCDIYNSIGDIYSEMENSEEAKKYYLKSEKLKSKNKKGFFSRLFGFGR